MVEVNIKHEKQTPVGWEFTVEIDGNEHTVEVDREYWNQLTHGNQQPAHLVKRSVDFLLAHESEQEIMQRFNLRDIKNYFPDYEDVVDHRK
jgi:hypothetical protein